MAIDRLRAIALGAPGLTAQASFFRDAWGLAIAAEQDGVVYLRGTGAEHHIVALHDRPVRGIISIDFGAPDRAAVDRMHDRLAGQGVAVTSPAELSTPGGGYGFTMQDPDGRRLRVIADIAQHADTADHDDRPRKLSHVVLNSAQLDTVKDFFCGPVGFRISDWSEDQMVFLRAATDHHCIALNRLSHASLNHVAFEMCSMHAYMRGQGRMKAAGSAVAWGPGRHGPGNNPFAYFVVPGNFVFEYTCELQQIDEATHEPKVWQRIPAQSDLWGTAGPPSPVIRAVMAGNPDPNQE
ncbi:MAG: VOC family protein [Alphaproteobacteria bacterium]|nr:VOC family protein [Alphaproteobacteria bacterium]